MLVVRRLDLVAALFATLALAACSSSSSPGSSSASSSNGNTGDTSGGDTSPGGGSSSSSTDDHPVSGTVSGVPFYVGDAVASWTAGTDPELVISFSTGTSLCSDFRTQKIPAGSAVLLVAGLKNVKSPGTYASDDATFSSLDSACLPGDSADEHVAASARAATAQVTITELSDTAVVGTVTASFASGSVSGTFTVPFCDATPNGGFLCR